MLSAGPFPVRYEVGYVEANVQFDLDEESLRLLIEPSDVADTYILGS